MGPLCVPWFCDGSIGVDACVPTYPSGCQWTAGPMETGYKARQESLPQLLMMNIKERQLLPVQSYS